MKFKKQKTTIEFTHSTMEDGNVWIEVERSALPYDNTEDSYADITLTNEERLELIDSLLLEDEELTNTKCEYHTPFGGACQYCGRY